MSDLDISVVIIVHNYELGDWVSHRVPSYRLVGTKLFPDVCVTPNKRIRSFDQESELKNKVVCQSGYTTVQQTTRYAHNDRDMHKYVVSGGPGNHSVRE